MLTKLTGGPDLRTIGSGNIGATNVLRTGNKALAAATLLGDMLKGTVAVLIAQQFGLGAAIAGGLAAGLGAFLGHLFPVWLGFKGGKGVATYIGVLLALAWQAALAFGVIWIAVAAATRYSSLSGLVASAPTPAILWFMGYPPEAALFLHADGADLVHAPRQYRAPAQRHRRQDRALSKTKSPSRRYSPLCAIASKLPSRLAYPASRETA